MRTYFFVFLLASLLSNQLTRWLARAAAERGWAQRHEDGSGGEGVPRLGGLSLLVAILLTMALLVAWDNQVSDRLLEHARQAVGLAGATVIIFLLGFYDDLRGARPWQKLLVQVGAGVVLFATGFRVELLTNPFSRSSVELGWLALPVTLFWLVAISNAFNLIDGLDGLAAGIGLFVSLSLFLLATLVGNSFVAVLSVAQAGALLGFLPHNFAPAKIYLGDSGSLTIGLVLAALAVEGSQKGPVLITVAIPLMIFGLPLLDVSVTTFRRFLSGHPLFLRDEEHLHHRLVKIGLTQRAAVLVLYAVAALFALASMLLLNYRGNIAPLIALLCGALAWVVVRQMQYPEFAELDTLVRAQRKVLRNQILLRKAAAQMRAISDLDSLWRIAANVFSDLEFASAACELVAGGGARPRQLAWLRDEGAALGSLPAESCWTLTVPLAQNGRSLGVLRLGRALDRGALLVRVSSLLEFVSGSFCTRLAELSDREESPASLHDSARAARVVPGGGGRG